MNWERKGNFEKQKHTASKS